MLLVENCICLLTAYFFKQLLQLSLTLSSLSCNAGGVDTEVWQHTAVVVEPALKAENWLEYCIYDSFLVTDECFGRPEGFKHTEILQRCVWRGIGGQMGQRLVGLHREMEQCTHSWWHQITSCSVLVPEVDSSGWNKMDSAQTAAQRHFNYISDQLVQG